LTNKNKEEQSRLYLLALPIGKRLCISAGFGLGNKKFAHSLANVEMTSVHRMKIFTWM
jgi:hypothetical protein